jgi:hypothetical protein
LIEPEEMLAVRLVASWLTQFRRGFGLGQASVSGLWAVLTSGGARGSAAVETGGDRALFKLIELHQYLGELGRSDQLMLVLRIAASEASPADARELAELRAGLQTVLALRRRGRGLRRPPEQEAARS